LLVDLSLQRDILSFTDEQSLRSVYRDSHFIFIVFFAGQPHEGSCYASYKDLQMAQHRQDHVKSRLAELDRLRVERLQQQQQQRSAAESGLIVPNTSLSLSDF
jgi:hypothetical protein